MKKIILLLLSLQYLVASTETLKSNIEVNGFVGEGETQHYKIVVLEGTSVQSLISNLSADVDLYVKIGSRAGNDNYDCRSTNGGTKNDSCSIVLDTNADVYLGVYGYEASSFNVKVELKNSLIETPLVIYEDAEDINNTRWIITDNTPIGATVTNVFDNEKNSRVIKLNSLDSYDNKYQLSNLSDNRENFNITWDMKTTEGYIIDIEISTIFGNRYLRYRDKALSFKNKDEEVLIYGLGYYSTDGTWHTHQRNLLEDLQSLEPLNEILSVQSFSLRAKGSLDNIELFSPLDKMYEDAEDDLSNRWSINKGPLGAEISNVYDLDKGSKVISLNGDDDSNQYIIGDKVGTSNAWNNTKHSNLKWSIQNTTGFIIYLFVNTQKGLRYIKYSDNALTNNGVKDDEIYFGLGYEASDGKWHTYIRDVAADIKYFDQENSLLSIDGFMVIGNSKIDDLELFNVFKPKGHQSGLALTFDDYAVDSWASLRDVYFKYNVQATFFVSNFHTLSSKEIDKLKILENEGHEIAAHTVDHQGVGRDYNYDLSRIEEYIEMQILPALNSMRSAGFDPVSFAYPYGERNEEFDSAVRTYFPYLRTTASDKNRLLYQLEEVFHKKGKPYNILAGEGIDNYYNHNIEEIRKAFIKARRYGQIITLYAHRVEIDGEDTYAISPDKLEEIIRIAQETGLKFYSFQEAYKLGN